NLEGAPADDRSPGTDVSPETELGSACMPGSKSAYLENALLNHVLGAVVWTPPTVVYVALSSELYDENAYGSAFSEIVGAGAARVAVANSTANWPVTNTSQKVNGVTITFPAATNTWPEARSFYLLDSAVG